MLCRPSTSGALRLTLRTNGLPIVLSVARRAERSEVEAGMPGRVRHDESVTVGLQPNVKRSLSGQRRKVFEPIGFKFDIKLIDAEPKGGVESVLPSRTRSDLIIK